MNMDAGSEFALEAAHVRECGTSGGRGQSRAQKLVFAEYEPARRGFPSCLQKKVADRTARAKVTCPAVERQLTLHRRGGG
jgi:hypothetical protein